MALNPPSPAGVARAAAREQILELETAAGITPKPFLRWAGGKTRQLRHLLPHFPDRFNDYYEPFVGGGASFFAVADRASTHTLTDLNEELINTWQLVQTKPLDVLHALEQFRGKDQESDYYEVRDDAQPPTDPLCRAARFIYLNQTAWNGLWRVNRWGRFNVPWGARPFRGIPEPDLLAVSAALHEVTVEHADFRDVLTRPKAGDFVYLDPPYLPVSDTSKFSGYTERRFRAADLAELSCLCEEMTERGVRWVLSNRDTELVRDLFSHAEIIRTTTRRSVAAQNRRDVQPARSPEAIIVGGF